MRALIAAWSVTLAILVGLVVWLQLSYEPPREVANVAEAADAIDAIDTIDAIDAIDAGEAIDTGDVQGDPTENAASAADSLDGDPAEVAEPPDADLDLVAEAASDATEDGPGRPAGQPGINLTEDGPYGPLPVSVDGNQPWRSHGEFDPSGGTGARIAIVVTGLGLNARLTNQAISNLPPAVSLAFSPYGQNLGLLASAARDGGHETLVMVPMEPMDYPINDPGPHSLLTSLAAEENIDRLHFVMSRFDGYVGLINDMGSRFTATQDAMRPVMADLQKRGVLFVDSRATGASVVLQAASDFGIPWAENTLYIDNIASGREIDRYLGELETMALSRGLVVGVGHPYPITVERIIAWAPGLEQRGITLIPITAAAFQRTVR